MAHLCHRKTSITHANSLYFNQADIQQQQQQQQQQNRSNICENERKIRGRDTYYDQHVLTNNIFKNFEKFQFNVHIKSLFAVRLTLEFY
jgi:hypothetical protein